MTFTRPNPMLSVRDILGLFGHISNFEYMQRNGRVIEMTRMTECILSCSERF